MTPPLVEAVGAVDLGVPTQSLFAWNQSFRSADLERSFQVLEFELTKYKFLFVGPCAILLQSILTWGYYVTDGFPLQAILLLANVVVLTTVFLASVVCWACSHDGWPRLVFLEKRLQSRINDMSAPQLPWLPPSSSSTGVAAFAQAAVSKGWISLSWCGGLLFSVLLVQLSTITKCTYGNTQATSTACAIYATGGYPLQQTLHTALFALFVTVVSSQPCVAFVTLLLMFAANGATFGILRTAHPTSLAVNVNVQAMYVVLALTFLGSTCILARTKRLAFIRLHNLVATFELYDHKVVHMAELEARESASRSALLATMSHEIRTPLTGIIGSLELALDTAQSNPVQVYLYVLYYY